TGVCYDLSVHGLESAGHADGDSQVGCPQLIPAHFLSLVLTILHAHNKVRSEKAQIRAVAIDQRPVPVFEKVDVGAVGKDHRLRRREAADGAIEGLVPLRVALRRLPADLKILAPKLISEFPRGDRIRPRMTVGGAT